VIAYYPSVPVGFQMGLGCAIYSYDQRLFIGLTADVAACPDVEVMLESLEEALRDLREAAGVARIEPVDTSRVAASAEGPRPKAARRRARASGRA
jgi:hypothetical protein